MLRRGQSMENLESIRNIVYQLDYNEGYGLRKEKERTLDWIFDLLVEEWKKDCEISK